MQVAATPAWFADNVAPIAIVTLVVLTLLVIRLVHTTILRFVLLGVIAGLAVLVYLNRDPLQACARTCECQIADQDITVPACGSDLDL